MVPPPSQLFEIFWIENNKRGGRRFLGTQRQFTPHRSYDDYHQHHHIIVITNIAITFVITNIMFSNCLCQCVNLAI